MSTFLLSYFFRDLFVEHKGFKISQYACAVLLIVSSIALLAGAIFGLDQYIRIINKHYHEKHS